MSSHRRWAPPPPPSDATRAERSRHAAEEQYARHEIRCIWDDFFQSFLLVTGIDGPAGVLAWQGQPEIGPITLGPPTRFSIKMRPSQRRDDFSALAPRLAVAYDVDAVVITDSAEGWLTILLLEHADDAGRSQNGVVPATLGEGTREATPSPIPSGRGGRGHRRPLGLRGWRRPFGGPRTRR